MLFKISAIAISLLLGTQAIAQTTWNNPTERTEKKTDGTTIKKVPMFNSVSEGQAIYIPPRDNDNDKGNDKGNEKTSNSYMAYAKKAMTDSGRHKTTWEYGLFDHKRYMVDGTENYRRFSTKLKKDMNVLTEFENNDETGLIGYLLFEDGNIVIDESDIPEAIQGKPIYREMLRSNSMGKSIVSYIAGHAICEGYISDINETLDNWDVVENTLFEGQELLDLLNMQAGDDLYIGERLRPKVDNLLKKHQSVNVNTLPLEEIMQDYFQNSKPHVPAFNAKKPKYNYSALTTNVIMSFVIHRAGDDWEKLLNKIFAKHVRTKEKVALNKTVKINDTGDHSGWYVFYATRHDYLRIGHAIMEDWHSDTCIGDYLRAIYDGRIAKDEFTMLPVQSGQFSKSYGGQFHFDIFGLTEQKIFAMSGFAGQELLIDVENRRIILVNSRYRNYDWKKIVYEKIKQ